MYSYYQIMFIPVFEIKIRVQIDIFSWNFDLSIELVIGTKFLVKLSNRHVTWPNLLYTVLEITSHKQL